MADDLQKKRDELLAERAKLQETVQEKEREAKASTDRKSKTKNLQDETKELQSKTAEIKDYCKKAHAEIDDFPTDTQILKLERRLESLKNQMKEAERSLLQRRTGIEAYQERIKATADRHHKLFEDTKKHNAAILEKVKVLAEDDSKTVSAEEIRKSMDALCAIAEEREAELQSLQQQISEYVKQETELSARIQTLQEQADTELPKLEAERERIAAEIRVEWAKEEKYLQATYDRLFEVNKEQQYHLARGTHIKKAAPNDSLREEQALSGIQARLATDINEAKARLKDVSDDLYYTKKQSDALRSEGRQALADFEKSKDEKKRLLQEAQQEREEAEAERRELRDVKVQLNQAIVTIRDS